MLTLESDNKQTIYCYVDASFSVHAAIKIHTVSVFSLVKVMIVADYTKHKVDANFDRVRVDWYRLQNQ